MDFGTANPLQAIQPVHVMIAIFLALMIGAMLSLRDMGTERRTNLLGKLLGKIVLFLGSLALGAILLTVTLGNSLPIGQVQSVIEQVQGVMPGNGTSPEVSETGIDFTILAESVQKLSDSGVFSADR